MVCMSDMEWKIPLRTVKVNPQLLTQASIWMSFFLEGVDEMLNQEYLPCNRQIHIKLSDEELNLIRERMEQMGFSNMSAYIRKMAIDGYYIKVDFSEIHELARLMSIDSRNINQIAKAANTYGWVDEKIIADMKAEHEKVLKTVKDYFDKLLEIM